jgi:hypothetical protein
MNRLELRFLAGTWKGRTPHSSLDRRANVPEEDTYEFTVGPGESFISWSYTAKMGGGYRGKSGRFGLSRVYAESDTLVFIRQSDRIPILNPLATITHRMGRGL